MMKSAVRRMDVNMSKSKKKKYTYHIGWTMVSKGHVTDIGHYIAQKDRKLKNEKDFDEIHNDLAKLIGVLKDRVIISSMSYLGKSKAPKGISGKE